MLFVFYHYLVGLLACIITILLCFESHDPFYHNDPRQICRSVTTNATIPATFAQNGHKEAKSAIASWVMFI